MIRLAVALGAAAVLMQASPPRTYPLTPLPLDAVQLSDGFWRARLETNRAATIPHIFRQNELTGRVANFAKAAKRQEGSYEGRRFNDTDVYKAIEAASYTLIQHDDPALERQLDGLIAIIAAAQEPDGYLYPARTIDPANPAPGAGPARWVHLNGSHELYNFGHLYEAAVAHHSATGKTSLLDVAVRNARLVRSVFGPRGRRAVPGHQEIELALVRLAEVTGDRSYAELARFFLDARGGTHQTEPYPDPGPFAMYNGREYKQDHRPVVAQDRAVGHAVRATYMYAGMTDIAALFASPAHRAAVERLHADVVSRRLYITGGIGARSGTESFGDDYELPNLQAYTETCAAVGLEQWAHRLFRLTGEGHYLDLAERVLYNGLLSGVSASGDRFFYQNPLASEGRPQRVPYFDVACCPANLSRALARLPGLVYAHADDTAYVALFAASAATLPLKSGAVRLTQRTSYPWDGDIELRVEPAMTSAFTLAVRMPGWSRGQPVASDLYRFERSDLPPPTLIVNGEAVRVTMERGFARVTRTWRSGDVVHVHLPMPVQRVIAHERVADNRGRVALQRGPLVYAFEQIDNGRDLAERALPRDPDLRPQFRADLLGGMTVLTNGTMTAVPYFAWANRGAGEMRVWMRTTD
jgi:DUF1680 family protein